MGEEAARGRARGTGDNRRMYRGGARGDILHERRPGGLYDFLYFLLRDPDTLARLTVLHNSDDGFELAQKDLELRGPGDLAGTRQSGEPGNGFLFTDIRLLDEVTQCVQNLRRDPALKAEKKAIEESAASFFATEGRRVALN